MKKFDLTCKKKGRKRENITKTQKQFKAYEMNIWGTLPSSSPIRSNKKYFDEKGYMH